jgi:hypothetical protein
MHTRTDIDATLREMIDYHEIRKLLSIYCHGCDRGDGPRMASVYLEDSWDDHGPYKGPGWAFAKRVMSNTANFGRTNTHLLGQSQIRIDGDVAGVETYFLAVITEKDEQGRDIITQMGGRYVDTLLREQAEWKIKKRLCIRDWSITLDIENDRLRDFPFIRGQLSGEDPSYPVLGLSHPGPAAKS